LKLKVGLNNKKVDTDYLHNFLKIRIPVLVKTFQKICTESHNCNYETFKNVIKDFNINTKYTHDDILSLVFEKHKNKDNVIDYQKFVEDLSNAKTTADMDYYKFKDVSN